MTDYETIKKMFDDIGSDCAPAAGVGVLWLVVAHGEWRFEFDNDGTLLSFRPNPDVD